MTEEKTLRPEAGEYAEFYAGYVSLVPETEILPVLAAQGREVADFVGGIAPERADYRYAEGKWSVRELIGHLIDAERVFAFRTLTFARGDKAQLPGFDENDYAREASVAATGLNDLAAEFAALREANVLLLKRLRPDDWARTGTANGSPVTVRALAYIMAGHVRHHLRVLRERYR